MTQTQTTGTATELAKRWKQAQANSLTDTTIIIDTTEGDVIIDSIEQSFWMISIEGRPATESRPGEIIYIDLAFNERVAWTEQA